MYIIGTLGPSMMDIKLLEKMIENGMNAVRISFSHINKFDKEELKNVLKFLKNKVEIIGDINGGKIRISRLFKGQIKVWNSSQIYFCSEEDYDRLRRQYNKLTIIPLTISRKMLREKDITYITMKENTMKFVVIDKYGDLYKTVVERGGIIRGEKGCNIPELKREYIELNSSDKENIDTAIRLGVDIIALSYVEDKKQIQECKEYTNNNIKIWSKIESFKGYANQEEIIKESDCVIIGRGDLIPEVGVKRSPLIEKSIIENCNKFNKPVIVATNLLSSLRFNSEPVISEAEAIYMHINNNCSGFMLSTETSISKNPINVIKCMSSLIKEYME